MRFVLVSFIACLAGPALVADELSKCAGIESAVQRLDCYDRLARGKVQEREVAAVEPPVPEPEEQARPRPMVRLPPSSGGAGARAASGASFGMQKQDSAGEIDHIEARIESVRKAPTGRQIMALSNGQVWMENERSRRTIAPDQDVIIRKHRWHYELEMASQPNVAVRRVK
jgi:hypothetical protein